MIINRTDCGMLIFTDDDLLRRLKDQAGTPAIAPASFHAFDDVKENVREQVQKFIAHPWVPKNIPVRGFDHDVAASKLREIQA